MSDLLLFLAHLQSSQVLLQLTLINAVFILDVLERNLGFLLELSELIEVLEDKMLAPLLVNLNLNLVLLLQVLQLTLLVSKLCLLVLEFLLTNEPKVVDP